MQEYADGLILGQTDGPVARLVFNNPKRHNAVSLEMWQGALEVLEAATTSDQSRMLIVSGAGGKAFVSGADISKFESERSSEEQVAHYQQTSATFYTALYEFPKPTLAAIRGYCIGGGMALAICCDMRIAEERARFGVPAAKLGLGYGYDGIKRLADVVGISMAMEIFYTARQFSSVEAQEMGLVNRVLPDSTFDHVIEDYTTRICENAPLTIATVKAAARQITGNPDQSDLDNLAARVKACFDSEDYVEGRRAFMEKRKPQFKGQ